MNTSYIRKSISYFTTKKYVFPELSKTSMKKLKIEQIGQKQRITLSRKGVSLKQYFDQTEDKSILSEVDKSYLKQCQQTLLHNLKIKTYHQHDYGKGEALLQKIPVDPYYSYTIADFLRKTQQKREQVKEFVSPYRDPTSRAIQFRKLASMYDEKYKKYALQQFQYYLKCYPGSAKGPLPEDDPDNYIRYGQEKIPPFLAQEFKLQDMRIKDSELQENQPIDTVIINKERCITDYFSLNRTTPKQNQSLRQEDPEQYANQALQSEIIAQFAEIPYIPTLIFEDYQNYCQKLIAWQNFRKYFYDHNYDQHVKQTFDLLRKAPIEQEINQNNDYNQNEFLQLEPSCGSLYRYYKTLPLSLQENPAIKIIYLGLEYRSPDFKYEEKEQALNYACTLVLPLDKVSERMMKDFTEKKKHYMTPFIMKKIQTINPSYTWDIHEFFKELKQQELRGMTVIKEKQESFPEPPPIHMRWQKQAPNVPVDYYDNDDGFWDEIISKKLKRYDQAKPIMKYRQHFTH